MGWVRALVVLASLAACDTSGVRIDVLPPADGVAPDHIRLFIGKPGEHLGAIGPEGFRVGEERFGWIWTHDRRDADDILPVSRGESASFGFVAESDRTELGAIIAVGYTGGTPTSAGSLFHVKTGVGVVRVFEIQLHAAVDPRDVGNRDKDVQIEIWGAIPGEKTCIHLNNTHPDRDLKIPRDTAFLVDEGDRDCDGYRDQNDPLECTAEVNHGTTLAEADALACALSIPAPDGSGTWCMLGGPTCTDGPRTTDTTECVASRYCAPESVCDRCQPRTGQDLEDCLRDPYGHSFSGTTGMFGIDCRIGTEQVMVGGPITLCTSPSMFSSPVPVPAQVTCSNATVSTVGQPASKRLEIGDIRFAVDVKHDTCAYEVTPGGELPPMFDYATAISGLATVDLSTGRSVAVPVRFVIVPPNGACGNTSSTCVQVGDDADAPRAACIAKQP